MNAQTRTEIVAMLRRHGLSPVHSLGQHFLADANITRKIVRVAGVDRESQVLEVGAGTGTLTRALAQTGATVIAYEVDSGLARLLEEEVSSDNVVFRFEDVMKANLESELGQGVWTMVSNLPYNVGTPLLLDALRKVPRITRFVVMIQREVAERLVAKPGSEAYGLPSVVVGIHSEARIDFGVPARVFVPAPRVDSAVVVLDRVAPALHAERAIELASIAFNQRRKMLRRSLLSAFDDATARLEQAGIDPTKRAEEISPSDYLRLASG